MTNIDKRIDKRIKELENKAKCNCWEYCYENGLTKEEQEEYDELVYGEIRKQKEIK